MLASGSVGKIALIYTFTSFEEFDKRVKESGIKDDLRPLLSLDLNFFERYPNYVVLNLRDYSDTPNNLLVLSGDNSFLYSGREVREDALRLFKYTVKKKHGESTALALIVLKGVLASYNTEFEKINSEIDRQEEVLSAQEIEGLGKRLRKAGNKVEDLVDLLIKLEERDVHEVNTAYVSYDYDVLVAKSRHLLDRIKSHSSQITGLRNEVEIRFSRELNHRIERLSDVVRTLTAITIILMIPTIVMSYYGTNFTGITEFESPQGPANAITVTAVMMAIAVVFFKWKKWL